MIRLGAVNISDRTKELMQEALEGGEIGQGKYIVQFERELAEWLGIKHAIAVANGTTADTCALSVAKYLNSHSEKDEVIVSALTFIAQINAIMYVGLKPVFIDVGWDFNIDTEKISDKISEKTLAIMPVHLLGRPANIMAIRNLAHQYGLAVIEDACEALGSKYYGYNVGTLGDAGCFSFFVSHSVTTGEGGAIVTNNDNFADMARSQRNHGRKSDSFKEKYIFPRIGFSGKMNSMEAIIGLGIMPRLREYVEKRRNNALLINHLLRKNLFVEYAGEYMIPHGYSFLVDSHEKRQCLLAELPQRYGIEARQIFQSIPTQCEAYAFLGEKPGTYPVAEDVGERGLYIPCHQNLEEKEIEYMAKVLKEVMK